MNPKGLLSIERVVAFVVGPAVMAGSTWLSLFLANNVPGLPTISGETIYGIAGSVGLATGGLIYKWLNGRNQHTLAALQQGVSDVSAIGEHLGISQQAQKNVIHIAEEDLRKLSESIANKIHKPAGVVTGAAGIGAVSAGDVGGGAAEAATTDSTSQSDIPPVEDVIAPPPGDPAPNTPISSSPEDPSAPEQVPGVTPDTSAVPVPPLSIPPEQPLAAPPAQ